MDEQQPTFKVVDRRPFNPDGTPRDVPPEEKAEKESAAEPAKISTPEGPAQPPASTPAVEKEASDAGRQTTSREGAASSPRADRTRAGGAGDPLDDPASFLSLIMSLASNAAASLGMMPHPVSGETGVDLRTAKHWIDVLGMLEQKTHGNLNEQEEQVLEGLLADLRMQYVSLQNSPTPPPSQFSASDITGGK